MILSTSSWGNVMCGCAVGGVTKGVAIEAIQQCGVKESVNRWQAAHVLVEFEMLNIDLLPNLGGRDDIYIPSCRIRDWGPHYFVAIRLRYFHMSDV